MNTRVVPDVSSTQRLEQLTFPQKKAFYSDGDHRRKKQLQHDLAYALQCCEILQNWILKYYNPKENRSTTFFWNVPHLSFSLNNCLKRQEPLQHIQNHYHHSVFRSPLKDGQGYIEVYGWHANGIYDFGRQIKCVFASRSRL